MAINPYDSPRGKLHARAQTTRRQFLMLMGGIGAVGATIFGGVELLKFMFPAATGDAPLQFKTTFTFQELTGGVTADGKAQAGATVRSITADRISVVVDDAGIYAVFLVCTHLGCTPNYVTDVVGGSGVPPAIAQARGDRTGSEAIPNGWACPCHGSRYFIDSTNFYGPAPRPMDWVDISVAPDGYFVVDRGNIVAYRQPGQTTAPQWRLKLTSKKSNGKTLGV